MLSNLIGIYHGVCRGADKAVVKSQSKSVRGRKIGINASALKRIAFAESCKETVSLSLKVVFFAYCDYGTGIKLIRLLIIADNDRTLTLTLREKSQTSLLRATNEGQRLFGGVMAVF